MKEIVALLPGVAAAWVAFRRSPQAALRQVYLFALLLLPDYYYWNAPGLPDPSFLEAAIVPIALAYFCKPRPPWRWSLSDLLVGGYAISVAASEYLNAGYKEAQNLMFDCVSGVLLPYVLAKALIEPRGQRAAFAKRMVLLFFAMACLSLYEFRFALNPYRLFFDSFFPGQGRGWVVSVRWGFGRIAGPYGHAILAGVMLLSGLALARWSGAAGLWPRRFARLPWLPAAPHKLLPLGILGGLVMTLCRGPWIGALLSAGVMRLGRARDKRRALLMAVAISIGVGLPAGLLFKSYVEVGRQGAQSATQETAAYRFELLQNYLEIVAQKPWLGWGRNTWPKVPGQPSIDNHYLLLLLMHGGSATFFFLALLVHVGGRLFRYGLHAPTNPAGGGAFAFTLLGILCGVYFAVITVFMGLNTQPLLFFMLGWSEGFLQFGCRQVLATNGTRIMAPSPTLRFARVLS